MQRSLYEAYRQRETEMKASNKDYRNRFATLTSDWVNRPAIPGLQDVQPGSRGAASCSAPHAVSAPPPRDSKAAEAHMEVPGREDSEVGESETLWNGGQGSVARSGPLAGVLSRSVGLVTSLAQHMRGLRSRRGAGEYAHSRNNSTSGSALLHELLQLDSTDACQQALTIAALRQNFSRATVSPAARQDMVEQLVKAGVVSSCAFCFSAVCLTRLSWLVLSMDAQQCCVSTPTPRVHRQCCSGTIGQNTMQRVNGNLALAKGARGTLIFVPALLFKVHLMLAGPRVSSCWRQMAHACATSRAGWTRWTVPHVLPPSKRCFFGAPLQVTLHRQRMLGVWSPWAVE